MNPETKKTNLALPSLILALCSFVATVGVIHAQPVPLSIEPGNNQVMVSWPTGLDLVQPEKATNLTVDAWQDFGAPTTGTSLADPSGPGAAYYRLRFLAPDITDEPSDYNVVAGENVTFTVTAVGTGPLGYQWWKGNAPLPGKTGDGLNLGSVIADDAGDYFVVVTNRAGNATSRTAALTVTQSFHGIFMGNFAGQADNGGFAIMVRSNRMAVAVGYNSPQEEGLFISSFTVADNGSFSAATAQGGSASGTFTSDGVSGTFVNSGGGTGGFSGNRKTDAGVHAANAGYYTGTYGGFFEGSAFAVLAADGSIFFYTIDNPTSPTADGDGGGFGTINAANSFSGTTVPLGLTVSGTLNPTTKVISGSYSMKDTPLGTFSLTRSSTP